MNSSMTQFFPYAPDNSNGITRVEVKNFLHDLADLLEKHKAYIVGGDGLLNVILPSTNGEHFGFNNEVIAPPGEEWSDDPQLEFVRLLRQVRS